MGKRSFDCVSRAFRYYPKSFEFKVGDSRKIQIPECDLLFIDTDHTYDTTLLELELHERFVSKWIVLHDTESFGRKDRAPGKGAGVLTAVEHFLSPSRAIDTFLEMPGDHWRLLLHLPINNGLTILERRIE